MKIVGLYNWHDGGYCVLEDGKIIEHIEIERYTRVKEDGGDSLQYLTNIFLENQGIKLDDIDYWVSPCPNTNLEAGAGKKFNTHEKLPKNKIKFYSHHLCHASHAFFSSNFKNSLILTIDSAGLEETGEAVSTCGYYGSGNKIEKLFQVSNSVLSLGALWGRCTRFIFKLSSGYPRGHQAGSVMAMAALGDHSKYYDDFMNMATSDFQKVAYTPPGYKRGVYVKPEDDVVHPYLNKYREMAATYESEKFNMAASLQKVTEDILLDIIEQTVDIAKQKGYEFENICLAGGVSLNSVFTGKILNLLKGKIKKVFIPPVPYDGGLSIGACQYLWYSELNNKRDYNQFVSPYLGENYSIADIEKAINKRENKLNIVSNYSLENCVDLLIDNKIISLFSGSSESGRRALGNRSIIASPRDEKMKSLINKKVKHRQWYRPFAPSVLEEIGEEWFENYFPSPYMGFVFKVKKEKLGKAPAIEHFDGTARIQSVNIDQNKNYYKLIKLFFEKTGIPMVLNTSFNDREPICETPTHAIDCFLRTDIDYLYFYDHKILLSKKSENE